MKAQVSILWKNSLLLAASALIINLLQTTSLAAQCGNTLGSRTYDTLVTGPGWGNYSFSFPKWGADSGTLISVKVSTKVSLGYGFTLKNADVVPSTYTIFTGRVEQFSSPALSVPFSTDDEQTLGAFPLNPGQQVIQPSLTLLKNFISSDSITSAVTPFIGAGYVTFSYQPITYTDIHTNNNSSYAYSATARDTMHFSITYTYCKAALLASSLTKWSAAPEGPSSVLLTWTAVNEQPGRVYEVEASRDGVSFGTTGEVMASTGGGSSALGQNGLNVPGTGIPGTNNYSFVAELAAGGFGGGAGNAGSAGVSVAGKWYFRLKWIDPGFAPAYSNIKEVTMGSGGRGITLYPVPATDHVNIVFDASGVTTDQANFRQVDILAADGRLVLRDLLPAGASAARIDFHGKLAAGVYFVRVIQLQQNNSPITASFLVN